MSRKSAVLPIEDQHTAPRPPELLMWAEVLRLALADVRQRPGSGYRAGEGVRANAARYLFSAPAARIMELLDLDPVVVRERLRQDPRITVHLNVPAQRGR